MSKLASSLVKIRPLLCLSCNCTLLCHSLSLQDVAISTSLLQCWLHQRVNVMSGVLGNIVRLPVSIGVCVTHRAEVDVGSRHCCQRPLPDMSNAMFTRWSDVLQSRYLGCLALRSMESTPPQPRGSKLATRCNTKNVQPTGEHRHA